MKPDRIEKNHVDWLIDQTGEALISLVIATERAGPKIEQNRIALKNAIAEADDLLERDGRPPPKRTAQLRQARALLEDREFMNHQSTGLAVYIDDAGTARPLSLSSRPHTATVCVSHEFHIRHVMASVHGNEVLVLGLAMDSVKLYTSDGWSVDPVEADIPESSAEVNWFMDHEMQFQQRPGPAGIQHGVHGHDPTDRADEDRQRFLRAVADGVEAAARELGITELVVLGDDPLVARFGAVTRLTIESPKNSRIQDMSHRSEIRQAVGEFIEEQEHARQESAIETAKQALGSGEAITELEPALNKALQGGIGCLVVHTGAAPRWGQFDPDQLAYSESPSAGPGLDDLVDRLIAQSLRTGSEIQVVSESVDGHPFVAIPRF